MSNFIATTTATTTIIGRSVPILWMDQVENANLITSFFFFVCLFAAVLLVLVLVKQTIVNCYIPQYLSYLSTSVVNNHNNNHNSKYLLTNLPVLSSLAAAAASTLTPHTTSVTTTNTTPTPTTTIATPTTPLLLSTNAITTFATTASVKADADADEDADDTNNTLSTPPPPSSLSSSPLSPTTTTPTTTIASHHHHHHQQQQQSTSLFNYSAATAVLSQFTSSTMSSICLIHAITSMVEYLCIFLTNELDLQLVVGGFKIYYGVIHFIYYACEMSVAYWIVFHVFRNRFMLNGMIQQYFSLSTSSSQQHAAANSHSSSVSSSSNSNNSNTSSNSVSSNSSSSSSSSSSRSNAATVINKRHNSSSLHDAEYDVMMSSSSPLSSSPTPLSTPTTTTPLLLSSSPTTSNDEKNHHHHHHHQRTQSSSSPWKNNQQQQQQQQENTFQQQYLQPLELKRLNRIRYLFCSCVIIGSVLSRSFIYIMWSEDDVSLLMHERASSKLGSVRSWVFLLFSGFPSAFSLYYSAQILYRLMQSISDILSSSSSSSSGSISSSGSNSASSMINNGGINVSSSGGSISINIGGGHGSESKRRNVSTFAVVRFCNRLRHLWKVVCASFYFVLMQEFCLVSVRQETAASPSSAGGHSRKNVIVDVTDDTARGSIITPFFNSTERTLATSAASILKSTFIYFILSIILQCKNVVEFVAVWTINFRSQSNAIGTVMNYGPILSRGILCCLFISFSMLYFLPFNRTRGRKVKSATATSYLILSHFSQSNKPRQKYLPF